MYKIWFMIPHADGTFDTCVIEREYKSRSGAAHFKKKLVAEGRFVSSQLYISKTNPFVKD